MWHNLWHSFLLLMGGLSYNCNHGGKRSHERSYPFGQAINRPIEKGSGVEILLFA
jgi:hypothetical protein